MKSKEREMIRLSEKRKRVSLLIFGIVFLISLLGSIFGGRGSGSKESIQSAMRDAVLHNTGRISLFGIKDVDPAVISAFTVTGILFVLALVIRIFIIPRFKRMPGTVQMLIEQVVEAFRNLAKTNSPEHNDFLGAYVFTAGVYIFSSTLFELFGVQAITVTGESISLPAPLSDIDAAICMGVLSYLVILGGGIASNKLRGIGKTLKEFSLPVSMSFRLFGALLSGALVTELVYNYEALSYGLPVLVGFMFTLLHALIQAYVLTMLTSVYYGEVSESPVKENKSMKEGQSDIATSTGGKER